MKETHGFKNSKIVLQYRLLMTSQLLNKQVSQRLEALDLFKFFILAFMIQGHLFRAYLQEGIRQSSWFRYHEILHGAAAPAFLFAAGFAAFLSFHRKHGQYINLDKAFWKRVGRILFIMWCSIWLHLPYFSLRKSVNYFQKKGWTTLLQSDILMCIAVSLLIFVGLTVVLKKTGAVAAASLVLGLLFFLLPRMVYDLHPASWLAPFLDHRLSSFPLFPWAGFLFLGVVCAYCYTYLIKDTRRYFLVLAVTGLLLLPWYFFYHTESYHRTEWTLPGNMNKTGFVFLMFSLAYGIGVLWPGQRLSILKKAGQETLFVYILHLFVLYRTISFAGIHINFKSALGVGEALAVLAAVLLAVFLPALLYNHLKVKYPALWRKVFYVFWAGYAVLFILRPY